LPGGLSAQSASAARLLELQAAVGARAVGQRGRGPARRARQVLGVARDVELDRCQALAFQSVPPVVAQERGELGELILLDQEVRLGPSTLAGARRAADEGRDAGGQATIAQGLHLGDRTGHRRDEREAVEQIFRQAGRERLHVSKLRQSFGGSNSEQRS